MCIRLIDCINVSFLAVISFSGYTVVNHWRKLGKGFRGISLYCFSQQHVNWQLPQNKKIKKSVSVCAQHGAGIMRKFQEHGVHPLCTPDPFSSQCLGQVRRRLVEKQREEFSLTNFLVGGWGVGLEERINNGFKSYSSSPPSSKGWSFRM